MAAGASLTIPVRAGEVKKGHHMMINGKPVKIETLTTSKTGKHGHAKANVMGYDIFTGKKLEDSNPTSHNVEAPVVKNKQFDLLDIDEEGYCQLMAADDGDDEERTDVRLYHNAALQTETNLSDTIKAQHVQIKEKFDEEEDVCVTVTSSVQDGKLREEITSFKTG